MTWAEKREKMDMAIKEIVIPFLREQGFKGSYPHFKREGGDKINLLTFQFSLYGPQFWVEIANCPVSGITFLNGIQVEPKKCRVQHTGNRMRIGPTEDPKNDCFDFGKEPLLGNIYKKRAKEVIENWHEAEQWWAANTIV